MKAITTRKKLRGRESAPFLSDMTVLQHLP